MVKAAADRLVKELEALYPDLPNARWVALRLLDGDERIVKAVERGELGALSRTAPEGTNGNLDLRLEAGA